MSLVREVCHSDGTVDNVEATECIELAPRNTFLDVELYFWTLDKTNRSKSFDTSNWLHVIHHY